MKSTSERRQDLLKTAAHFRAAGHETELGKDAPRSGMAIGLPVDTVSDVIGDFKAATQRADVSPPNAFDGEIQIALNHRKANLMVAAPNTW